MHGCSRPGCGREAGSTLTYDYAAQEATLDRLLPSHPMQYDLCDVHADRLSVPRGWSLADVRNRSTSVTSLADRIAS